MARSNCLGCDKCKDFDDEYCHQGLPVEECPKARLENEKLLFGALLLIAVVMLVWTHCC